MSCFLKNHSDAGKKSNLWDKENVWALKHYTTILLYGRSRLRTTSVTRFIDMRPVYSSDKLKKRLKGLVRRWRKSAGGENWSSARWNTGQYI